MKEKIILKLKELVEKEMGKELGVTTQLKNNGISKTCFYIKELKASGKPCPNISIDVGINAVLDGDLTLAEAAEMLAQTFEEAKKFEKDLPRLTGKNALLESVQFELINVERNKEKLKQVPYILFWDMAATFKSFLTEHHSVPITNKLMEDMGTTVEELSEYARKNIHKTNFEFSSIVDMLIENMEEHGTKVPEDVANAMRKETPMYVLRGKYPTGASFLMFPEVFEGFANEKESDLFIIPSSIQELIVVPANCKRADKKDLKETLVGQNKEIEQDIVLCDHIFKYSRKYKNITIAL